MRLKHKSQHRDKDRRIAIGPQAQAVLKPWLLKAASDDAWCFPSRGSGSYTTDSYRRAIQRTCERHNLEKWSPNQLRHAAATCIREQFDAEHAQAVLGHTNLSTTEIYAEVSTRRMIEVAQRLG